MFIRLFNFLRGLLGLGVSGLERSHPEALLELERKNLQTQLKKYDEGMVMHLATCKKLENQIKRQRDEEEVLLSKIRGHLEAGNEEAASEYALNIKRLRGEVEENQAQLADLESTYRSLLQARDVVLKNAQAKIEALRGSINDLKMKRAIAEMTEFTASVTKKGFDPGSGINRLERMVEEEKSLTSAKAQVNIQTSNFDQLMQGEAERKMLARQALDEVRLALPQSDVPVATEK